MKYSIEEILINLKIDLTGQDRRDTNSMGILLIAYRVKLGGGVKVHYI